MPCSVTLIVERFRVYLVSRVHTALYCSHRSVLRTIGALFTMALLTVVTVFHEEVGSTIPDGFHWKAAPSSRGKGRELLMGLLGEGSAGTVMKFTMGLLKLAPSSRGEGF